MNRAAPLDRQHPAPLEKAHGRQPNLALWAMLGIPLATVLASALTIFLAVDGAEPPLPSQYVAEGEALAADLALDEAAQRAGIEAELTIAADGRIELRLAAATGSLPESLRLRLTHAALPALDRNLWLRAVSPGRYTARMAAPGNGAWLVQLDGDAQWRLRGRVLTPAARVSLGN